VREFVTLSTLLTIYNSLIQPIFDYCNVVLDNMSITLVKRLQKLQNRAAAVITCQGYEVRSNDIRSQLNSKTLSQIRNIHKGVMMYKILHNMTPVYLRDHFKMSFSDQAYSFRNRKLCLILPRAQTEFLKKSFVIISIIIIIMNGLFTLLSQIRFE
jgi:tRNA(Met) C34 N-acetyltransferase TmcA